MKAISLTLIALASLAGVAAVQAKPMPPSPPIIILPGGMPGGAAAGGTSDVASPGDAFRPSTGDCADGTGRLESLTATGILAVGSDAKLRIVALCDAAGAKSNTIGLADAIGGNTRLEAGLLTAGYDATDVVAIKLATGRATLYVR